MIQRFEWDGNQKYGSIGAPESSNFYKQRITLKRSIKYNFWFYFMLLVIPWAFLNKQTERIILSNHSPQQVPTHQATRRRGHVVCPNDVAGTSQMKHPTTSQWYVFSTSYWYVVTTSQGDVMTTSHQYVFATSQISLKWNTQRHLKCTYPRRPISTSLRRFL